jgi:hypothetical protein
MTPPSQTSLNRWRLFAGCIIVVAVIPLCLGAGDDVRPTQEVHRRQIQEMTAAERRRLELNFQTYRQLSDSERENYDKLHRMVEDDPSLRELMYVYAEWLKTLSPWEREELRKETDPAARVELVRQFKEEQERKHLEQGIESPGSMEAGPGRFSRFGRHLDAADLAAVFEVLEASLPPDLIESFKPHDGLARYVAVLDAHLGRQRPGRFPLFSDELTEQMIAAIADESLQEQLTRSSNIERRRNELRTLISRSLWVVWWAEFEKRKPSDDQIYEFYAQLPPRERADYTSLPPDEAKRKLMGHYMRAQQEESGRANDFEKFRRVLRGVSPPRSFPRGPGRSSSKGGSRSGSGPNSGPREPRADSRD